MNPPLDAPEIGWVLRRAAHGPASPQKPRRRPSPGLTASAGERTVCICAPDHAASLRVAAKLGYMEKGMATFRG